MTEESVRDAEEPVRTIRESCERIGVELANILRAFAPSEEVLAHFRAARVEILKGLRAAIDARIERATAARPKGRTVPID